MILGVDPGYAKCGWSVVDPLTARVVALGVIITKQDPLVTKKRGKRVDQSTDRARRVGLVSAELAAIARAHGVTKIAAEQALGHGAAAAVAANMLPWGAIIMLAILLGIPLVEVKAKTWQHAILDIEAGKVDYDDVEAKLTAHVGIDALLEAVKKGDRTHAVDGVGIAYLALLRPWLTTAIVDGRTTTTLHVERKDATA